MATASGSRLAGLLSVAILGWFLTGCQHPSSSSTERPTAPWRVMERVGDVRATRDDGVESGPLRPGETIADDHHVTTREGTLLILSRNGFQLTAGENTSFRLPGTEAIPELLLDRGWLRVRLATPVDREARIKTAEFDISASQATLTLQADPTGTSLVVDAGSVVLTTTDGRHRANLVAGAAAKMAPTSSDDLLIQRASGRGFTKASPLPASSTQPGNGQSPPAPENVKSKTATAHLPPAYSASKKASAPDSNLAILPASRPKKPDGNRQESLKPIADAAPLLQPAALQPSRMTSQRTDKHPSIADNIVPSSMPEGDDGPPMARQQQLGTSAYDPVQLRFDRLTEGLLEGL